MGIDLNYSYKCIHLDGDWETDHEKYAKFDEVTKNRWPDGTVSTIYYTYYKFLYFKQLIINRNI